MKTRDWIRQYLPSAATIRRQRSLGVVRHWLLEPELWHLHRRAVSGGCFIGLFCAFMPVPGQMLIAALLAVLGRCNLPIAVGLVWVTNPITFGPIFFFAYKLGAWLLDLQVAARPWELSWQSLWQRLADVWWPLLLGALVCGWVAGLTGAVLSRLLWRIHVVRRLRERRRRRVRRRAARPPGSPAPP